MTNDHATHDPDENVLAIGETDPAAPAMTFDCHPQCGEYFERRMTEMQEFSPLDFAALLDRIGIPYAAGAVNKAAYEASVWLAQWHASSYGDDDDREQVTEVLAAVSALDDGDDSRGPIPPDGPEHEERIRRLADYEAARAHLLFERRTLE